jgi:hypothetical protein
METPSKCNEPKLRKKEDSEKRRRTLEAYAQRNGYETWAEMDEALTKDRNSPMQKWRDNRERDTIEIDFFR